MMINHIFTDMSLRKLLVVVLLLALIAVSHAVPQKKEKVKKEKTVEKVCIQS